MLSHEQVEALKELIADKVDEINENGEYHPLFEGVSYKIGRDESKFEALRKNWVCPKCEKARKNIQPTGKCSSPPRSALQQLTVDATSQLLLSAIKDLTEEVKVLKFSFDANANKVK
ncbi:unnamed protein product [Nezara viridula]|uniref:Uncharacterized protein n=1 Tax=Nezara viridula TaxID=85310 RepID=A0A9P0EG79_NEZVI|nr:unnamed protein product [Nezara viridula]